MVLLGQIFFAPMRPPSARFPLLTHKFDHWFARSCDRNPANRWVSAHKQLDALLDALNVREMPPEIPASLAQQVMSLTPLHLEDAATNEPSLMRIVSPKREGSHDTLVGAAWPSTAASARDADSIPSAIAEMPTEKFDSKRHAAPLRDTVPDAPSEELLSKARGDAPTPITDLPTEPFDPKKHRAASGAAGGKIAEAKTLPGSREDSAPVALADAPTSVLAPKGAEFPTLPLGVAKHSLTASRQDAIAGERDAQPYVQNAPLPAAKQLPQWLVFTAGLLVGLLILILVLAARQ